LDNSGGCGGCVDNAWPTTAGDVVAAEAFMGKKKTEFDDDVE
jgi:hypothetical protein